MTLQYIDRDWIHNITSLISESYPYILPFQVIDYTKDGNLITELKNNQVYYNQHFDELLQVISTIGSYNIALKTESNSKHIYLGHHLRVRKTNFLELSMENISAHSFALMESSKKAKTLINMYSDGNIVYSFELEYTILNINTFKKLFVHLQNNNFEDNISQVSSIPLVENEYFDNSNFNIKISAFNARQCLGHFENYPMVPAVRITQCLLKGIKTWIEDHQIKHLNIIVDGLEMFPNFAMPININYTANVVVKNTSNKSTMFLCSVNGDNRIEYGNYIILIK